MTSRAPLASLLLLLLLAPAARASKDAAAPSPTPTLMTRTLQMLHLKHRDPNAAAAPATVQVRHQLELKMDIAPRPVTLSDTRQMRVTVSLSNRSKKFVHLDFPTTQRIEVLLKNGAGKTVTQWSEDQSFADEPASITVNPGERLEYAASVPTREMAAGQTYTVEAYFPHFPELKIDETVAAQP